MKNKLNLKKVDSDILEEIIAKCDKQMVSGFKKKGVEKDEELDLEDMLQDHEEEQEPEVKKDDLSDLDFEDLKRLYSQLKD